MLSLELLHRQIDKIIPIEGISINEDGSYRIDYVNEPDQSQIDAVNSILQNWPLESLKLQKIDELNKIWEQTLQQGWTTPYGWKLGLTTNDLVLLNGNFTLAKEAQLNGLSSPIFVIDTDNDSHEMSLQELTVLMLQYGAARANLSSLYSAKLKLIKEASSENDLNNIVISI